MAATKNGKTGTDPEGAGAAAEHGGDGAEVAGDRVQVVEYAAAIDVAKGSGMVCTRVPGSRPDRRRQKVWRVEATYREVTACPAPLWVATTAGVRVADGVVAV